MDIITAYATQNECYITGKPVKQTGIIVHSTGANNPYLKRYVDAPNEVGRNIYGNHFNRFRPDGRQVCVHSIIGLDMFDEIRVANILPYEFEAWGVGAGNKGSYNFAPNSHIQFEICEDDLTDESYFNAVFVKAAEYCACLCKRFDLSVSSVISHAEAYRLGYGENHADPEHWLKRYGKDMAWFRAKVNEYMKPKKEDLFMGKTYTIKEFTINIGDDGTIQIGGTVQPTQPTPQPEPTQPTPVEPIPVEPIPVEPEDSFKPGDKVRVRQDAYVYGTSNKFSQVVYRSVYEILQEPKGDRVVFGTGEVVIGAVHLDDIIHAG